MDFGKTGGRRVVADFDGGKMSADAGAHSLGETNRTIRLVERFSAGFQDRHNPIHVVHRIETFVALRVFGLALGP
jgi:hypothetical protein